MNANIFLTLCKKNKIERLTNENIFWFFPCFFVFLLTSINNFDFVIRYPQNHGKKSYGQQFWLLNQISP